MKKASSDRKNEEKDAGAPVEELDTAEGRARHKEGVPALHAQTTDVQGMEAIDVLLEGNLREHSGLVDVGGKGQLHQNTVDIRVAVKRADRSDHIRLCSAVQHAINLK